MQELALKVIELLFLLNNFSMMLPCLVPSHQDGRSNVRRVVHTTTAYNVKSSVF